MVNRGSIFVKDILIDVLKRPLTSELYVKYGGSRNVFYNLISRNRKYIGDGCADALKKLLLDEVNNDNSKKQRLFEYFKRHLTEDVATFIESNPHDLDGIITLAISNFTHPANVQFSALCCSDKNNCHNKAEIDMCAKEISGFYLKTAKYLNEDLNTAFILVQKTIDTIFENIIKLENLEIKKADYNSENVLNVLRFKDIIPDNIDVVVRNLKSALSVKSTKPTPACFKEFVELTFSGIRVLVRWFLRDYLNSTVDFESIDCKAKEAFYYENDSDGIKAVDVYDLMDMGWSVRDCAKAIIELSCETIDDLTPERLNIEQSASGIEVQPETRRFLIDNKSKVVGYLSFLPLFEETFSKVKSGKFSGNEVTPDTIAMLVSGTYNVYFTSACLEKRYRKTFVLRKLLFSVIEQVEKLAIHGIFINEICTWACSTEGKSLCKSIGLIHHVNHIEDGEMYCGSMDELMDKPLFKNFGILRALYTNNKT